jgi:hypothetical protein
MLIAILEDNRERIDAMRRWLDDRFRMYETYVSNDPETFNSTLEQRWNELLLISLDHDLFEGRDGLPDDDGMTVATFLATREPRCPIVIHSSNTPAALRMKRMLDRKGWTVSRVIPFDDTAWIVDDWIPTVRRRLRNFAPTTSFASNSNPLAETTVRHS